MGLSESEVQPFFGIFGFLVGHELNNEVNSILIFLLMNLPPGLRRRLGRVDTTDFPALWRGAFCGALMIVLPLPLPLPLPWLVVFAARLDLAIEKHLELISIKLNIKEYTYEVIMYCSVLVVWCCGM